ncbi:MAG: aldo/keto reductase [Gammaproteobacteria bacterium]
MNPDRPQRPDRRDFMRLAGGLALAGVFPPLAAAEAMRRRAIPSSGEAVPVVGLGTAHQFDVAGDPEVLASLKEVLLRLFEGGGTVIDTSPMYGRAEAVLGQLMSTTDLPARPFLATKVWTRGRDEGIRQMKQSMSLMGTDTVDLMQVHNLVDWRVHMETLRDWKEEGTIRYTGITHYRTDAFDDLETVMREARPDWVQLNYSILTPAAEQRLLPLARELGIAVMVNRPYERGEVFGRVRGRDLPEIARELECATWGQFFLKWVLGHPAVTCAIPGTSNPRHVADNVQAGFGPLPDAGQRARMREAIGA